MILVYTIVIITILQITAYILLDKYKLKNWKYLILGFILLIDISMPPGFFIEKDPNEIVKCGNQSLGIKLFFMILGGAIAVITHFIYVMVMKFSAKNKNV
ncbi:hypothetical protein HZP84_00395 [Elizabethkingia anophelis]|uniref:Uncharacterized protein n=1 Tax=Elizabethkingia anophelis TaxID=1117645 RepID=X5K995_9FLAO|nr:hypothetical protein [Elizabethkingia anophelis]MCT3631493.1 hypothetical protein [Elizabethkingia anophelis]MCT3634985.1 hypothetical protein [Elizabethkingia anophelis]MCT3690946.1 hypothetical protein [Elizabethkingia anophelis]MCT3720453.1 hypothetical protein [Elizabethkingia anophelis]MCT3723963.1 hypothetical protein [Elizabethkingia anophelis]